jgi:hypothetical protein
MLLAMTRDGVMAAVLGIAIVVAFVGYNTIRTLRRRYTLVKREPPKGPGSLN